MPASLRSDLYSHQTGIHYSHRRNTQFEPATASEREFTHE